MDRYEEFILDLYRHVREGGAVSRESALELLKLPDDYLPLLVHFAQKLKRHFFPENEYEFCSIINAKSGACTEDCGFCAQSGFYRTPINIYGLVPKEEMIEGARRGVEFGANRYCIVLSGKRASAEEIARIGEAVREIREEESLPINVCVSAGTLGREDLEVLKSVGVSRVNHNLETSENFFPRIVTTHSWRERFETILRVKEAGLSTCSGGVFGMGESDEDRVDLALTYRELGVDSIPLNFLMPIPGTPLAGASGVTPFTALRIIALFRFTNPRAELRLCGGREQTLRDFHGLAVLMVNAMMVGGYLTRAGRDIKKDYQLLEDLSARRKEKVLF
ncbi:MAG TPA: biotin synthase BioB [Aquifex aeolicus]|uniref:Biotin synthase n=1 Tax=Aquifex aeolicus TaxID=63363 RepID=A0A7C5L676_AQUAO|nr:biotin synthase BioB [Aquifex aeolicus]